MKHLTIAISIFLLTLTGASISFANSYSNTTGAASKDSKIMPAGDVWTYVRVCIADKWWTYWYLDGSFIVAIPDADE